MNNGNKKQNKGVFKLAVSFILLAVVLYIVFQVVMVLNPSIKTRTAIKYDLNDSISCTALMSMPQEEVYYDGGVPDYLINNGDKVAAGGEIARVFASTQQAQNYTQAQLLKDEITLLKNAQISTPGVNIESLLMQSKSSMHMLIDSIDDGDFINLDSEKADFQSAVNKTQIATGKTQSFEDRITALTNKEAVLLSDSGEAPVVYAPKSGYFVSSKYSQAQQYSQEELKSMSAVQLKEACASAPSEAAANVLGRLIYDYKWDCYVSVSNKEAEKFIEGKTVYLTFSDISLNQIPAKVTEIIIDEANDTAKITLSGDYMTADIAAIQHTSAVVTFPYSSSKISYTGIRIPKEALRIVNGEFGVYIRYGNLAQYKRIQILFENDKYILAPLEYEKGKNELKLYDEIIIEGRGLLPKLPSSSVSSTSKDSSSSQPESVSAP